MLKLNKRRPTNTFFETSSMSRWKGSKVRNVCVALLPQSCSVKWKGTRQVFDLPWSTILDLAVQAHALSERRRKAEEKAKAKGQTYKPKYSVRRGVK